MEHNAGIGPRGPGVRFTGAGERQLVESKTKLAKLENYDPCFSRTSSAFFAVTFCLR